MGDLIDRGEAIAAINGLTGEDAVAALKAVRARIRSPEYVKLLPCTCGAKSRGRWCTDKGVFLKCNKCGKESPAGKWETDARKNWNAMIQAITNDNKT